MADRFATARKAATLAKTGAVRPIDGHTYHVTSGRNLYTVSASATRKGVALECNCQAGQHGILCSHVGAVQQAGLVPTFPIEAFFQHCAEVV